MQTESSNTYPNEPMVEVAVYMKDDFVGRAGRTPEDVAVEFLAGAFSMAEINYEVHYDLPPQSGLPTREEACGPQFEDWDDRVTGGNVEYVAKDSNVLLVDGRGGGCGRSIACAAGVQWWDEYRSYDLEADDPDDGWWIGVNALLHEVGHNFGFPHNPDGGYGFMRDGYWHRTPTLGSNGVNNQCMEFTQSRPPATPSYRYGFYHWCAITKMDIANDSREASPPSTYPPVHNGSTIIDANEFPTPPDESDQLSWDTLDITGTTGQVQFTYALENESDNPIEATLSFTAIGNEEIETVTIDGGDTMQEQSVGVNVGVGSITSVKGCATIRNANYV